VVRRERRAIHAWADGPACSEISKRRLRASCAYSREKRRSRTERIEHCRRARCGLDLQAGASGRQGIVRDDRARLASEASDQVRGTARVQRRSKPKAPAWCASIEHQARGERDPGNWAGPLGQVRERQARGAGEPRSRADRLCGQASPGRSLTAPPFFFFYFSARSDLAKCRSIPMADPDPCLIENSPRPCCLETCPLTSKQADLKTSDLKTSDQDQVTTNTIYKLSEKNNPQISTKYSL
jgi:hypothetical protein